MGLHLERNDWQALAEAGKVRAADIRAERRIMRDGVEWLAHGALICPGCDLPIALSAPISIATPLRCFYCEHEARAREFVTRDVFDTLGNEVYVVAHFA